MSKYRRRNKRCASIGGIGAGTATVPSTFKELRDVMRAFYWQLGQSIIMTMSLKAKVADTWPAPLLVVGAG